MKNNYSIDINLMKNIGISPMESMILENIHFLSVSDGWCFASKKNLAKHHGITERGLFKIRAKLEDNKLLKSNSKGHLKTTKKYSDFMSTCGYEQSSDSEQSSYEQSSDEPMNKVPTVSIKKENEEKRVVSTSENISLYKNIWNVFAKDNDLSLVAKITDSRKKKLMLRIGEIKDFEKLFNIVIEKISDSGFLLGENDRGWKLSFDWLIENDTNIIKVYEGKYDE